jgi:hypothetical protein
MRTEGGSGPETIELEGAQRALHSALGKMNGRLATIYVGGLVVLSHEPNPDRHSLCAHALRELIEKLPEHVDVPTKARGESLRAKVNELHPAWDRATKGNCHRDGVWGGEIDTPLQTFLARAAGFFAWLREHLPRRRDEAARALRQFDATGRKLPEPLESLNVDAWDQMRDYFTSVAHHRKSVDPGEFTMWVGALERFLLDLLVPRTFDDFGEIDALLKGDADA